MTDLNRGMGQRSVQTYVFLDLESTGLGGIGERPRITELSLVAVDKFSLLDPLSSTKKQDVALKRIEHCELVTPRVLNKLTLCMYPMKSVTPTAATLTGLYNDNLFHQKDFDKVTADLLKLFLKRLMPPVCLLAHNGKKFDFPLLQTELRRIGCPLEGDVLCADTLEAFRQLGDNATIPSPAQHRQSTSPYVVPAAADYINAHSETQVSEKKYCDLKANVNLQGCDDSDSGAINKKCVDSHVSINKETSGQLFNDSKKGTIGELHSDSTIGELQSNSTIGELHNDTTSGELNSDTTSGELNSDTTSGELHSDGTSGELHSNSTSGELHSNSTSGGLHSNSTISELHNNSTSGGLHSNSTSGGLHSTSGELQSNSTIGELHSDTTSGELQSNSTISELHSDSTIGELHSNSTIGELHSDTTSDTTSGELHSDGTSGELHSNSTSGELHSNSTSGELSSHPKAQNSYELCSDPVVSVSGELCSNLSAGTSCKGFISPGPRESCICEAQIVNNITPEMQVIKENQVASSAANQNKYITVSTNSNAADRQLNNVCRKLIFTNKNDIPCEKVVSQDIDTIDEKLTSAERKEFKISGSPDLTKCTVDVDNFWESENVQDEELLEILHEVESNYKSRPADHGKVSNPMHKAANDNTERRNDSIQLKVEPVNEEMAYLKEVHALTGTLASSHQKCAAPVAASDYRSWKTSPAKRRRISYKLCDVHERVVGCAPLSSHTAEDDCLSLVRICRLMAPSVCSWVNEHASLFSDIKPMYTPGKDTSLAPDKFPFQLEKSPP